MPSDSAPPAGRPDAQRPLVSVILPVHDRAAWIARAIDSVLGQSYPALELIVVDDGSVDGTAELLARYEPRIRVLRGAGGNAYAARNLAIAQARGELIAFIDSDDRWWPDHLARVVPLFGRPAVALAFGDTVHVSGPPDALRPTGATSFGTTPPARGRVVEHFLWGDFVPTTTAVLRRVALPAVGPFDPGSPVGADYALWVTIARDHELDHVDGPVAEYTVHPGGISHDLGRSLAGRIASFERAAAREPGGPHRVLLRRLLVHLALHLAFARLRGKAPTVPHAMKVAVRTVARHGRGRGLPWALSFAYHHVRARVRRARARPG